MTDSRFKILLVDDEPDILELMEYNLKKENYEVIKCSNGRDAINIVKKEKPDLIILDIMMPEMDGIETCRAIRQIPEFNKTMITFLTARNEDYSQIAGFDVGADDYITKPIKPRVLISRINALLRRYENGSDKTENISNVLTIGDLQIDRDQYLIIKGDEKMELPRKEFELLALLATKPGKVFTRETILEKVWGSDVVVGDRTIDVHIRKLREKLGEEIIKTVKGIGYKFDF
jgi:two-component system, OmpR family, alkaline phosphatase synthesis response regulator PhoP